MPDRNLPPPPMRRRRDMADWPGLPDTPRRRAPWLNWRDMLAAVVFSLAALIAVSAGLEYCAQEGSPCGPARTASGTGPAADPAPDMQAAQRPAAAAPDTATQRAVLTHAFDPLPLSFENRGTRTYVLPPGRTMLDMATEQGRIALDDIALIAVVSRDGVRHALVRLPDGRIARLQQGDLLDGGTVAAISEDALYLLDQDQRPRALVLGG